MNFDPKSKFIFWLLIFLVVVNVSMFLSFFFLFSEKTILPAEKSPELLKDSFTNSLALSSAQTQSVDSILVNYKKRTRPIVTQIRNHRIQILEELEKGQPDRSVLNEYEEEIAVLQKEMQKASVDQYLELKKICTPEQCERLSTLYRELYGTVDDQGPGQGNRHRHRGGRGH
jgi:Spy/CpxP family protein refolding chaperone